MSSDWVSPGVVLGVVLAMKKTRKKQQSLQQGTSWNKTVRKHQIHASMLYTAGTWFQVGVKLPLIRIIDSKQSKDQ